MYSRTEVIAALTTTGLLEDPVFKIFMARIAPINAHTIYSEEARDIITNIIYDPEIFDATISGMIKFYNELVRNSNGCYPMCGIYSAIYSSPLLKDTLDVCFRVREVGFGVAVASEGIPAHIGIKTESILFELIVLLNIYG